MGRENNKYENIKAKIYAVVILLVGIAIIAFMKYKQEGDQVNLLERSEKEETISLYADSKYGRSELEMDVLPYRLSDEELTGMLVQFKRELKQTILGENESFESVSKNLNLVDSIEDYPFDVEYRIYPRGAISKKGELSDIYEDTEVEIQMIITYEDYEEEESIFVHITELEKNEGEKFDYEIKKYLDEENITNRENTIINLPKEINGESVVWKEKKQSKIPAVIILTLVISVYVFTQPTINKMAEEKKKRESIKYEYPRFAFKYAILVGTGLSHRQIIEKIYKDYSQTNSVFGSELKIVIHEMKSGVSQTEALNHLANRCRLIEMTHFVSLINQNIRKGGKDISEQIKLAAIESVEMEKEELRKRIEKSGTKLLFPTTILLLIVFVLIMVPAFNSFSF